MSADNTELRRLGEGGEAPTSLEAKAGMFLLDARPTTGLRESDIDAIARRLQSPRRARPRVLVPVLVALAVLLVTGTVAAVVGGWRPRLPTIRGIEEPLAPPSNRRTRARPRVEALPVPPPAPAATESPPPAPPRAAPTSRPLPAPRRLARVESPAAEAAVAEGALSVEARSLANALAHWRRGGHALAALTLLDEHDRRFPHGALAIESRVARAEILLGLSRKQQALAVLDSLPLANLPRARELETLRGELRAQAGRCNEARADLRHVMASTKADALGKRAARALAACP
jgi:hypothetical protein